jgi:hypothetical protein
VISIDVLPDEVLLAIFDFCADEYRSTKKEIEAWQSLVHVCCRWRGVVFGSPSRLDLRLVCSTTTPARDTLDVWPALPLFIQCSDYYPIKSVDNIIAVLERRDRICEITLRNVPRSRLEKISAAMHEPFPELTHLLLWSYGETVSVLPDSFLGGSAPRLQVLSLEGIPFPGLPKLLLSATHLVHLYLERIPHSGYFSLEAMLNALSTLTSLQLLRLEFRSPRSDSDRESQRPRPPTRSVLPVLTELRFKGVSEYLDGLVAYIVAPQLKHLGMTFFNQIVFDTPQIIQFISRTPTLEGIDNAHIVFVHGAACVNLSSQTSGHGELNVKIPCKDFDWQVSSLEQVCTLSLPPFSNLEDLYIYEDSDPQPNWQDNIEHALWLELLHPFATVKNLYLSKKIAPLIVPALQELVGGRTTEVLPILQNILLEELQPSGPAQEGIGQFFAARQVTGHPIIVSHWDRIRWQGVHVHPL